MSSTLETQSTITGSNNTVSTDMENNTQEGVRKIDMDRVKFLQDTIEVNKKYELSLITMIQKLENLVYRVQMKRQSLHTLKEQAKIYSNTDKESELGPYVFGAPYFKDKDYFPGPSNLETKRIRENKILRYINLNLASHWTVAEKARMKRAIKKQVGGDFEKEALIDWHTIAALNVPEHSVDECKAMWNFVLHPNLRKTKWSESETEKLINAAEKHKFHNWEQIAKDIDCNRSHLQCFIHFHTEVDTGKYNEKWSPVEEQKLLSLVDKCRVGKNFISWARICQFFDSRTRDQIYSKFLRINPNIKKGVFSEEEDSAIMAALITYNNDFKAIPIEDILPGRSLKQIKARYNNCLKHMNSPVRSWDASTDMKLLSLVTTHGRKWSMISKLMDFRTGSCCRHRFEILKDFMNKNPGATIEDVPRKPRRPKRVSVGKILNKIDQSNIETPASNNAELSTLIDLEISEYFSRMNYYKNKKGGRQKTVFDLFDLNRMKNMVQDFLSIFGFEITQDTIRKKISETIFHNYSETDKLLLNFMIGHYTDPIYNHFDNDSIKEDWLIPTSSKLKRTVGEAEFCYEPLANKKIKTYHSQKCDIENTELNCEDDSKKNVEVGKTSCTLLPPNSSTLVGMRSLMITMNDDKYKDSDKNEQDVLLHKQMEDADHLKKILKALFTWPALMSYVPPNTSSVKNECSIVEIGNESTGENSQAKPRKKQKKQTSK